MSKKSKLSVVPATEEETAAEVITEAKVPAPRVPYFDHSNCDHEKTPKARAACRAKGDAAVYYGRDKAPKADAPTKTRKGRKAALTVVEDVPAEDVPAPKTKKVKLPRVMWSSKGTGAITHWAVKQEDDTYRPACGNTLKEYVLDRAAEVLGCTKCRAKGAPTA